MSSLIQRSNPYPVAILTALATARLKVFSTCAASGLDTAWFLKSLTARYSSCIFSSPSKS